MNLRCFYCQTPFTLGTEEKITALKKMHAEDLHHYDAHCPRCGRANPVSRERLEMFTPGWEAAIKAPAAVGSAAPATGIPAAPAPMMGSNEPKTAPVPAMKKEPAKAPARRKHATAAKKAVAPKRKPAARKTVAKAKKKPVAKAKPKKSAARAKPKKSSVKSKAKKK